MLTCQKKLRANNWRRNVNCGCDASLRAYHVRVSQHIISCFFACVFLQCAMPSWTPSWIRTLLMWRAAPSTWRFSPVMSAPNSLFKQVRVCLSFECLFLGVCLCPGSSPYFCSQCIIVVRLTYSRANWHPYFISSSINVLCMLACSGSKECFVVLYSKSVRDL